MKNESIITPLTVQSKDFNTKFIQNLKEEKYLKILGNHTLSKEEYNNLLLYTNLEKLEVEEIDNFEYENDIEINTRKQIEFKTDFFKKLKLTKTQAKEKTQLTITLPFKLFFENDNLYSEEDDFNNLLKYTKSLEMINIRVEENKIDEIIKIINKIENKIEKPLQFINIITENKTIKNIEQLKTLEEKRIVKIWYEDGITDCTIDEFIIMRKNIDEIVNKINKTKLTKFEKLLYVYDIVKKFNYKKSEDNYSMDGRQLHKIFTTNNLVCSGYAKLTKQILNELGITAGIYKLITKNNELHTRNIVHIIDEKYNINCLYSMDPTWESAIKQEYSYSLFLTPIDKLKEYFPKDRFRQDIDVMCGIKKINEIKLIDKISLYNFFNNIDITQEEIDKIILQANKKATLNDFINALINVKEIQGLSRNTVILNAEKIVNYNNELVTYLNKNLNTKINFFEEK